MRAWVRGPTMTYALDTRPAAARLSTSIQGVLAFEQLPHAGLVRHTVHFSDSRLVSCGTTDLYTAVATSLARASDLLGAWLLGRRGTYSIFHSDRAIVVAIGSRPRSLENKAFELRSVQVPSVKLSD